MYINVNINGRNNLKVSLISMAELQAIRKDVSQKAKDIIIEGDTQVARVVTEGDTQVARVIAEGDVQVGLSQEQAWNAEAEALTADSTANAPLDTFTSIFTSNGDGTFTETASTFYSAFHWSEKAKFVASGLVYVGNFDASGGVFPPNGTVTGEFYIVSVAGTINTEAYNVGDWMVWDNATTLWNGVHWRFGWAVISDVTVSGALPTVGDDLARSGTSYTKSESDAIDLIQNDAIDLNTAKVGITTAQSDAIVLNTAKVSVPIGSMVAYNGLIASIPASWALCDGNNGTVNMTDKFIYGTATEAEIGTTGGSNDAVNISHTHTFTGDALTPHSHTLSEYVNFSSNAAGAVGGPIPYGQSTKTSSVDSAGTPSGTVSTDGAVGTGLNIPAYVKFAWIQRIS